MRTKLSRLEASCDPYVSGQSMVTLGTLVPVSSWCQHNIDVQTLVIPHEDCWWETKKQFILETTPVFLQLLPARTRWMALEHTLSLIEPPSLERNLYIRCIIRWYTIYNYRFLKCTVETKGENPSSLIRKGVAKHHFLWSRSMVHWLKYVGFEWFSKDVVKSFCIPSAVLKDRHATHGTWLSAVSYLASPQQLCKVATKLQQADLQLILAMEIPGASSQRGRTNRQGSCLSRHSWRWSSQVIVSTKFSENLIIYL